MTCTLRLQTLLFRERRDFSHCGEMVPEVVLAVMMLVCVTTVCLWTNCERKSDLLQGRYTVPGSTFEV